MKKRRVTSILLGIALGIVGLLAGLFALHKPFRDDATIMAGVVYTDLTKPNDAVTRTIRVGVHKSGGEWGYPVSLMPAPLQNGTTLADATTNLTKAGYKPDEGAQFSLHKPRTFPDGSLFFHLGVSGLPCALRYEVVLVPDATGRVAEAYGTEEEVGCL